MIFDSDNVVCLLTFKVFFDYLLIFNALFLFFFFFLTAHSWKRTLAGYDAAFTHETPFRQTRYCKLKKKRIIFISFVMIHSSYIRIWCDRKYVWKYSCSFCLSFFLHVPSVPVIIGTTATFTLPEFFSFLVKF